MLKKRITMIEFEDGSGFKFNYIAEGEPKRFINLKNIKYKQ